MLEARKHKAGYGLTNEYCLLLPAMSRCVTLQRRSLSMLCALEVVKLDSAARSGLDRDFQACLCSSQSSALKDHRN